MWNREEADAERGSAKGKGMYSKQWVYGTQLSFTVPLPCSQ